MVTSAVSGPLTQSASLTGGKSDSWVGPGVGLRLTAVHCAFTEGVVAELVSASGDAVVTGLGEDVGAEVELGVAVLTVASVVAAP